MIVHPDSTRNCHVSACLIPILPQRSLPPRCNGPRSGGNGVAQAKAKAESSFRVAGLPRDIRVKIAAERHEFEQAFALIAENYRARGYEAPGEKPFRFTPH